MERDFETAEASELGLKPGEWPLVVKFGGVDYIRHSAIKSLDNELQAVRYRSFHGCVLEVAND